MVSKKEELISNDKELVNKYKEHFDQLLSSAQCKSRAK